MDLDEEMADKVHNDLLCFFMLRSLIPMGNVSGWEEMGQCPCGIIYCDVILLMMLEST